MPFVGDMSGPGSRGTQHTSREAGAAGAERNAEQMTSFVPNTDKSSLKMATNSFPDPSKGDRFPVVYGYVGITLTICFFQLLNVIVHNIGAPKQITVPYHRWKNLVISWTHALIVGTWDILCFVLYPEMMDDLIEHYNWFTYSMVVFSTGYFIYDFLDLLRAGKLFSSWEIILHHWAVISMFFYDVITCRCIAYNAVALLAEVNSFFLHSRKLLQMHKVDYNSRLYRTVSTLNLMSFPFTRFLPVFAIFYGMYMWGDRVSGLYYYLLTVASIMMFFINCILVVRLVKSDILRPSTKPSKESKNLHAANNNVKEDLHLADGTLENNHTNNFTTKPKMN